MTVQPTPPHSQSQSQSPAAGDAQLQTLLDSVRDGAIIRLDRGGAIQTWNEGAARLTGYRGDEVAGRHFSLFQPPSDGGESRSRQLLERAEATGSTQDEGWRLRKDGSLFWADIVVSAIRDDRGELIGFAKMMRDLTERRRSGESLRQSEQRFRLLVDSLRDYAVFLLDPDGRVETWNTGARIIKGYQPADIIGHHIETFYTADDRAARRPQRLLAQAAADGRAEDEGWRLRKDGTRFWADVVITALHDGDGTLVGYAKVTRDLTERRAREDELRRSEERFRLLVEGARDYAIFMLDPEGRVATWNAGAERIKGYRSDEIIGEHLSRFYSADDIRAGKCELELEVATRDGRFEDEGWRLRKDGSRFWANVVLTALRSADGTLLGFAKITRDLTARRQADDERLRLGKAQEAVRLRDEFLSIAAHELRTPLTALKLQIESLAETASHDPKLARKIERAARSGDRLAGLIDSLLDVTRLSAVGVDLRLEACDLGELVTEIIHSIEGPAAAAGSSITLRQTGAIGGVWDRMRLGQVVTNLLVNAVKYGAGSPISVQLWHDGATAVLEVSDRGPGIAAADLTRIFDRFERAASIEHYGGLGLGLYISREIVVAHGGTVTAANNAGGGARFTVRLPLVPPGPAV